jgi:hypothetical protein
MRVHRRAGDEAGCVPDGVAPRRDGVEADQVTDVAVAASAVPATNTQ